VIDEGEDQEKYGREYEEKLATDSGGGGGGDEPLSKVMDEGEEEVARGRQKKRAEEPWFEAIDGGKKKEARGRQAKRAKAVRSVIGAAGKGGGFETNGTGRKFEARDGENEMKFEARDGDNEQKLEARDGVNGQKFGAWRGETEQKFEARDGENEQKPEVARDGENRQKFGARDGKSEQNFAAWDGENGQCDAMGIGCGIDLSADVEFGYPCPCHPTAVFCSFVFASREFHALCTHERHERWDRRGRARRQRVRDEAAAEREDSAFHKLF